MLEMNIHRVVSVTSERCWPANGGSVSLSIVSKDHGTVGIVLYLSQEFSSLEDGAELARRTVALHLALGGKVENISRECFAGGPVRPEHIEAALMFSDAVPDAALVELRECIE